MRIAKLTILLSCIALLLTPIAQTQSRANPRVVDWSGGYFGLFYPLIKLSGEFADLESITVNYLPNQKKDEKLLMPDKQGFIPTVGELVTNNKVRYQFKKSKLIEGGRLIKIELVTQKVTGISYSFTGEYLDDYEEVRKGDKILGYIHLKGTLTKFKDGRKTAETIIGLAQFGIE